jgi:hypothetical protein
MFDNLRDDAQGFRDEAEAKFQPASGTLSGPISARPRRFLGLTALQRFIIAVLLMTSVCVLGAALMFVTGKMAL